jgi:hypothetical protein
MALLDCGANKHLKNDGEPAVTLAHENGDTALADKMVSLYKFAILLLFPQICFPY